MNRSRRAAPMAPADRRAAIIAATIPLLRERGWNIPTRDIAKAAGVAEGTIFSVFSDKEELLLAALDEAMNPEPVAQRLAQIDRSLPLRDQLALAVDILHATQIELSQIVATLQLHEIRSRLPRRITGNYFAHGALAELFEPHRDQLRLGPEVLGQAVLGLTMVAGNPGLFGTPLTTEQIITFVLGVMGPEPTDPDALSAAGGAVDPTAR